MRPFYRRTFLNRRRHHAGAYVIADVRRDVHSPSPTAVDAILTISDCHRVVTLDFDFHDATTRSNALYKARLLREVVAAFVDHLERVGRDA